MTASNIFYTYLSLCSKTENPLQTKNHETIIDNVLHPCGHMDG